MKKLAPLCCALALVFALSGCGQTAAVSASLPENAAVSVSESANPQRALAEIYENIDTLDVEEGDWDILEDKFLIDSDLLDEAYYRYASGRFGVADVFILKPVGKKEAELVREALESVKLSRAKEFENYDIYNAHQIAQDASIFEQHGYVIMLMLPDNEAARTIIDQYIPKK